MEKELFQRGWGVFVILEELPEGWGGGGGVVHQFPAKMENPGRGVLSEIPPVVGVWIFSGTTLLKLIEKLNFSANKPYWKLVKVIYVPLIIQQRESLSVDAPLFSWNSSRYWGR